MLSLPDTASDVVVNQVKDHFQSALSDTFNKNVLNSSSTTKHIINIFKEKKTTKLPQAELEAMGLMLFDYFNKVFREIQTMEGGGLVYCSFLLSCFLDCHREHSK